MKFNFGKHRTPLLFIGVNKRRMKNIFLGLGSNLGDRLHYLEEAFRLLEERGVRVVKKSSVHETEPMGEGTEGQNLYLNMVVEVDTDFSPEDLLRVCLDVENQLGRVREKRWGPRTIDIDVLTYRDKVIDSEFLTLPHPRMHERDFVLIPLREIL